MKRFLKSIYVNTRDYIKENIKELIFFLGFIVTFTYPLPYYILVSGGTIDVSDRVEVEDGYKQKGSFNLAYVSELKCTLPTYILSHFISDWTLYSEEDYTYDETENAVDIAKRDKLYLKESFQNSVKTAYEKAGKDFKINSSRYYIYYVEDTVKEYADVRVGDKLVSINGKKINDIEEYRKEVEKYKEGDSVEVVLQRGTKKKTVNLKVKKENDRLITGIIITTLLDYEVDPEITFKFKNNESGSSGGLTLALAIYNKLTKEDITKGYKIVGTGTIDSEGKVGEIGGVTYKLKGAVKDKADVFIVPEGNNYKDAKALADKKGYKIKIIPVKTFDEALEKLNEYTKSKK